MPKAPSEIKTMFVDPFKALDMMELLKRAFEENEDRIMGINKQQLDKGKDAKGESLGKYRNFKYKGRYEPVDLLKTGEFRRKFTMEEGKNSAEIFSQDQKATKLEKRYGKDIFGINKQFEPNVADIIKPTLGNLIKEKLKA